ncbi:hypothetical protein ACLOJK_013722 [Asimina triloba]
MTANSIISIDGSVNSSLFFNDGEKNGRSIPDPSASSSMAAATPTEKQGSNSIFSSMATAVPPLQIGDSSNVHLQFAQEQSRPWRPGSLNKIRRRIPAVTDRQ